MKKFRDPESALHSFEAHTSTGALSPILHHRDSCSQTNAPTSDIVGQMKYLLSTISEDEQAAAVCALLQFIAPPGVAVPSYFVTHTLKCMKRLKQAGRSNILAGPAKALGTMRPDGSDSRMPVSEMPVGLIEYAVSFLSSDSFYQVYILYVLYVCMYCGTLYIFWLLGHSLS